jgi:hypothetical protein
MDTSNKYKVDHMGYIFAHSVRQCGLCRVHFAAAFSGELRKKSENYINEEYKNIEFIQGKPVCRNCTYHIKFIVSSWKKENPNLTSNLKPCPLMKVKDDSDHDDDASSSSKSNLSISSEQENDESSSSSSSSKEAEETDEN